MVLGPPTPPSRCRHDALGAPWRGVEEEEEERFYSPFGGNGAYWTQKERREWRGVGLNQVHACSGAGTG